MALELNTFGYEAIGLAKLESVSFEQKQLQEGEFNKAMESFAFFFLPPLHTKSNAYFDSIFAFWSMLHFFSLRMSIVSFLGAKHICMSCL